MKRFVPWLIGIGLFILYASFVTPRLKIGGDAVDYVRLAHALAHGEGYRIDGQFNSKWPPVTPLIHSVVVCVAGVDVTGFKIAGMLTALAGLWFSYLLLKRHYASHLAGPAVLLAAVSFPLIYWVVDVSSEAPFLLFSMAALWLAEESGQKHGWRTAILTGIMLAFAALSRTVGLALLVGFGLAATVQWLRARPESARKLIASTFIATLIVAAWFAYSRQQSGQTSVSSYGSYAFRGDIYNPNAPASRWQRVRENATGYAFIFAVPDASLRLKQAARLTPLGLISASIVLLAFAGWAWRLGHNPRLPEFYLLVYGAALLTVAWYDIRYVVPIMPLLFFYFATSMEAILRFAMKRLGRPNLAQAATVAVLALLILANTAFSAVGPQARRLRAKEYSGNAKEIHDAAMWAKQHAPGKTVMARQANMVWFWTQLRTVGIPLLHDPETMWGHIRRTGIEILIADADEYSGVTTKYLKPALQAFPERTELVAAFGRTQVYRVLDRPTDL